MARCPEAERVAREVFWLSQTALLGSRDDLDDIVAAIRKIQAAWG
jgi:hypothetical protein